MDFIRSTKDILLSGEYVECVNKLHYEYTLGCAEEIVRVGKHPEGMRFRGIIVAFANPWFVKVLF